MISSLLSAASAHSATCLIINDEHDDSLSQYLGLKYNYEFIEIYVRAKLAYQKDGLSHLIEISIQRIY